MNQMSRSYLPLPLVSFLFALMGNVILAQSPAPTPFSTISKIALMDTDKFDNYQSPIKEYAEVYAQLEKELAPKLADLTARNQVIKTLSDEMLACSKLPECEISNRKLEQARLLSLEIREKKEDYDTYLEKRTEELKGGLDKKVRDQLRKFAAERGIKLIFDISKNKPLIGDLSDCPDVTTEFIDYYNRSLAVKN